MINFKELSKEHEKQIKNLYKLSFPKAERKPFTMLYKMRDEGAGELLTAFDGDRDTPVGISFMLTDGKTMLLDYLAVEPDLRSKGYGGQILEALKKRYPDKSIIIEIEKPIEENEKISIKARRKAFYLRNGFTDSGIEIKLFGVDMQLLYVGKTITYELYLNMLKTAFGEKRAEFIDKNVKLLK